MAALGSKTFGATAFDSGAGTGFCTESGAVFVGTINAGPRGAVASFIVFFVFTAPLATWPEDAEEEAPASPAEVVG